MCPTKQLLLNFRFSNFDLVLNELKYSPAALILFMLYCIICIRCFQLNNELVFFLIGDNVKVVCTYEVFFFNTALVKAVNQFSTTVYISYVPRSSESDHWATKVGFTNVYGWSRASSGNNRLIFHNRTFLSWFKVVLKTLANVSYVRSGVRICHWYFPIVRKIWH